MSPAFDLVKLWFGTVCLFDHGGIIACARNLCLCFFFSVGAFSHLNLLWFQ